MRNLFRALVGFLTLGGSLCGCGKQADKAVEQPAAAAQVVMHVPAMN